ncbi:MAG: bifunctional diguanylate cyclase/phosphodiesterase [Betaproteobacteria bacterium]|nr:MAG: bifunctional diguanylate cyclase/phosphodiesterase [Betaproteobacteria bacterium]
MTALALAAVTLGLIAGLIALRFFPRAKSARKSRSAQHDTATRDALTGLPNRQQFEEHLARLVQRADRHQRRLALLFINLDGFKPINEALGLAGGDAMLRVIGERMMTLARPGDIAAHVGGDEFLMLLDGNPGKAEASDMARRLLAGLAQSCEIGGRDVAVSGSIGIAMYPEDGALSKLMAHADAAMNASKRTGGSTYCFFEPRMVEGAREQVELLRDLRRAIEQGELELYYQPKIHAPSGQITGVEALMRWHHPKRGMVGPMVFIPIAERFGLIGALGNWVIEDACRQIREWRDEGLRMRVAINLSVQQLRQPDLVKRITDALQRHRVEPGLLTCEFTESAAMDDAQATLRVIEQLSGAGVHLSIDDFGTGYSSLSYLRRLPAHELKIDGSFVQDLETSSDARAIVDAVVKLAQALGRKVVAEGVETEEQQRILRSLGCHELQGYLFAKPMSAKALALWAMNNDGPRDLNFRASLFSDTVPQTLQ